MIATVTLNPSLDEWVWLPSLRVGGLNRAAAFARYPGGKGINVSRVIHELGGRSVAFALAGGEDGVILRRMLRRLRVRGAFVEVSGSTRNNYKILTEQPRRFTEVNTPGPRVSPSVLRALAARLLAHRPAPRCVVFSGSLPPGAPSSTYRRWIRLLRRLGIPAALDTSGSALREGLAAKPWLIKPNRQEAEELLRRRLSTRHACVRAARDLSRATRSLVILSLGAEGALFASDSPAGVWFANAPTVHVDSAVGAGDSLVGGFLASWVDSGSCLDALRVGVASGSATAMTPGTELCHRDDVRRLVHRVVIRQLA